MNFMYVKKKQNKSIEMRVMSYIEDKQNIFLLRISSLYKENCVTLTLPQYNTRSFRLHTYTYI